MNVMVSGATGFFGTVVVKKLLKENHSVSALVLPHETHDHLERANIVPGDITKLETFSGAMENHDAVIHLAGSVGYGQSWEICRKVNIDGTRNMAVEAARSGVRRFIHMSSVSVYGRTPNVPISEKSPLKKIGDHYGDTKIDAEKVVNAFSENGELEVTVIRPTVIYGPGDIRFFPKLVENIQSGSARVIGDGNNTVDLIHVEDAADFVTMVLSRSDTANQIYNLTHPQNPTWKEMLSTIADLMEFQPPKKHLSFEMAFLLAGFMEFVSFFTKKQPRLTRYAVRVVGRQYHYQTEKMQEELGFFPRIELRDGLKECVANLPAN